MSRFCQNWTRANEPRAPLRRRAARPPDANVRYRSLRAFRAYNGAIVIADDKQPDPPLNLEQSLRVSRLTQAEIHLMDRELLAQACADFRTVGRIVGMAIDSLQDEIPGVPYIYYAQRVRNLVALGEFEAQGNLEFMRYGEVRLPTPVRKQA